MIRKFKKFTKLSAEEKNLFLEAYYTLGIMRAGILTVSFKRLTRTLEHKPTKEAITELDEESKEKMKAHAWSQCGDSIITGGAGHEEFTVLSVFGW